MQGQPARTVEEHYICSAFLYAQSTSPSTLGLQSWPTKELSALAQFELSSKQIQEQFMCKHIFGQAASTVTAWE